MATIDKGDQRRRKQQEIQEMLTAKISQHRLPIHQLKIHYSTNRSKFYTEEEDRFLLVMLERFGYGSDETYDKIRQEIRKSPLFRFDWFFKSRTSTELAR